MRRRLFQTLAILFLLLAGAFAYRVLGVYRFRSVPCAADDAARLTETFPSAIKVMTFNIEGHATLLRGNEHIEDVAATIRKHNPDIVAINEAHRGTWQVRFGDHMDDLRRLTGMNAAFGRSYTFMRGHFGNAILTRGEIVSTDVHELPGTGEPRSLLDAVIRVNGGIVQVYVTHTSAWGPLGEDARSAQLRCVADHLRASRHPYIVAGDLNASPDSDEMKAFLARTSLGFAGDPATPSHRVTRQRLDYILTGSGWTVRHAEVIDEGPSDHRPVLAELAH